MGVESAALHQEDHVRQRRVVHVLLAQVDLGHRRSESAVNRGIGIGLPPQLEQRGYRTARLTTLSTSHRAPAEKGLGRPDERLQGEGGLRRTCCLLVLLAGL